MGSPVSIVYYTTTEGDYTLSSLQRPLIPPTVSDQIRLWERERDRLEFGEGETVWEGGIWEGVVWEE